MENFRLNNGKMVLIFCILYLMTACSQKLLITPTALEVIPTSVSTSTIEATPTQELEPLQLYLGAEKKNFYRIKGYDVDQFMEYLATKNKEYPYQYVVYTDKEELGGFSWSKSYDTKKTGVGFTEQLNKGREKSITFTESEILDKILGSGYFSENSIESTYQIVVLVTREKDNNGKERNGFFTYSDYGFAIYVDEDNDGKIEIWRGDNIKTSNLEIRDLFEQGYTQVRKINGKYKGMFKKGSLPDNININLSHD
jgi:hypothetical protein